MADTDTETQTETKAESPTDGGLKKERPRDEKSCRMDACARPYRAKGYCAKHYRLWRHGELPKHRYKICTKEGCRKPRAKGSLCQEHAGGASA